MVRKFNKFAVFTISILIATLTKDYIIKLLNEQIDKNLIAVWIIMGVTVAIYYPLFTYIDKYVKKLAESYVKGAKNVAKSSINGLIIAFVLALLICFALGAYVWFDINLIDRLF